MDTTAGGVVYYRQASSSTTIDNEIRRHFSNAASFTATWVLIATWHNVGYFSNHADKVLTLHSEGKFLPWSISVLKLVLCTVGPESQLSEHSVIQTV